MHVGSVLDRIVSWQSIVADISRVEM
jgi:hypothetical protein